MAGEFSFDVVSEFDAQELRNALDQARREITTRFDFKGSLAEITQEKEALTIHTDSELRAKAIRDLVESKAIRRSLSLKIFDWGAIEPAGGMTVRQRVELRRGLGDEYMDKLLALWKERVPAEADLCCYWFEKARAHLEAGKCQRAGLLATQGIRGGANREVLKRIKGTGDIFFAISDREWTLAGATVHISMVGFDKSHEKTRTLDGRIVFQVENAMAAAAAAWSEGDNALSGRRPAASTAASISDDSGRESTDL
jgi:uncharacterized protein YajQ (UPF0234 family)